MKYTADELLLKEVIEEMGLFWDETEGDITINGISAVEFLNSHNIFKVDSFLMQPVGNIGKIDFEQYSDFVLAA